MLFPFPQEKKNSTTQRGFSHPRLYHIILPSQNRYENRYELLNLDDLRRISKER